MHLVRQTAPLASKLLMAAVLLAVCHAGPARAQFGGMVPTNQFELGETVQLDQADNAVLAQLERVRALLAERQWDEAVEILRQVAESSEGKLLGVTSRRFVGLREACQLQLASLPPEALKLYRGRVDPLAKRWYEQGLAERNSKPLENIVQQAFASSYGDAALMALGEMALESADYAAARSYWQRIVPMGEKGTGTFSRNGPEGAVQKTYLSPFSPWPGYPDTKLDLAAVRARLVLVSILEGAGDQARDELAQLARLHPDARGRLGAREGKYTDLLAALLAESAAWPATAPDPDWPTLAGNFSRNKIAPRLVDVGAVAWRVALRPAESPSTGENPRQPLSFHPLVVGNTAFVNDQERILAVRANNGKPAWGESPAIYQSQDAGLVTPSLPPETLGTPQFTMSVFEDKLFARLGSPVTGLPHDTATAVSSGYLVCLDLAAEGRLRWKAEPEEGWAFEGAPVADERGVYVAMRHNDIRPQACVACLDADTGRLRWRRFVCSAETPARAIFPECTHNLLTLAGGTIYCNTNLGAVAAVAVEDGRLLWVSLYPRDRHGSLDRLAPHWRRELNPCIFDRGTLLVAPADCSRIFALDAATGQALWQTGTEVEDAVDLLGTTGRWLIAGGRKLYWISLRDEDRGRVKHVWPEGADTPGYGRGVLAGDAVLWSTRERLYLFDQQTAQPRKVVDLAIHAASGGNLLMADGRLLIATGSELIALGPNGGRPNNEKKLEIVLSNQITDILPCLNTTTSKP
jgi:outer membrane protein assembly factor BamB